jgi:hypothetical protein
LKKPGASDAGDAAGSASAEVEAGPAPQAVNEADVSRYPDETPVNHVSATTKWTISNVRSQVGAGGELVAALRKGTETDKIAERQGYDLVLFDDPGDSSRKKMGWVSQAVYGAEPPHKRATLHCPGTEVAILLQGGDETCVSECTSDANCHAGWACDGDGVLSNGGQPGNPVKFCRIAARTGGADGGAPPTPPVVKDAGPAKLLDVKKNKDGSCPTGYGACGAACRLSCKGDSECGVASAHCTGGFCLGPGAAPCK